MNHKPLILVTNDDGIDAPGIRNLIHAMRGLGEIVVVAPDTPQSGKSHSITINVPLRYKNGIREEDYVEYSCNGTPVDCVKLAVKIILDRKPDLLVSGINHGSNASINVIYSGTMAAVIEGTFEGIPSVGFSLDDFSNDADFTVAAKVAKLVALKVLEKGLPDDVCLNVNIPAIASEKIKGFKICRQAKGIWEESFETRVDPHKKHYYWLTGEFKSLDSGVDTDDYALNEGYVAIVPVHCDLTAYNSLQQISDWNLNFNNE
ncbi:MAG: 5'/3'-nucleotidase SurE [Bacteroidota bacterium]